MVEGVKDSVVVGGRVGGVVCRSRGGLKGWDV